MAEPTLDAVASLVDEHPEVDIIDEDESVKGKRKRLFQRECMSPWKRQHHISRSCFFPCKVRMMMFGFGDAPRPNPESVNFMEELVLEYTTDMVHFMILRFARSSSSPFCFNCKSKTKMEDSWTLVAARHAGRRKARKGPDRRLCVSDPQGQEKVRPRSGNHLFFFFYAYIQ